MKEKFYSYNDIQAALEQAEVALTIREVKEANAELVKIVRQQQKTIEDLAGGKNERDTL